MPHVRINRFGAGNRQHHSAQSEKRQPWMGRKKIEAIGRVERAQDRWRLQDLIDAEHAQDQKPYNHDRSENCPDAGRAAALEREQADDDHYGNRNDIALQIGCCDLQTLDCTQN